MESKPQSRFLALAALSGTLGPVLFTIIVVVLGALWPGYSHLTQAISELGGTNAPNATNAITMDANFLLFGILTIIFAIGLYRNSRSFFGGSVLVGTYGLAAVVAAFFPCDPGCPVLAQTATQTVHDLDAAIAFIALAVAPLIVWRSSKTDPRWRGISTYSLATALAAIPLAALYLTVAIFALSSLTGLLQRLFLAPLYAWMVIMALRLFKIVWPTQTSNNPSGLSQGPHLSRIHPLRPAQETQSIATAATAIMKATRKTTIFWNRVNPSA